LTKSATELAPVCILAGGLGTRLGEKVKDTPKPLLPVAGQPFVFHQLELLREYGARRIVLCVAYLGELIEEAVGDGSALGLEVSYSYDGPDLAGTAGAVRRALPALGDEFLVLYGDSYLRIDYLDVQRAFRDSGLPALMTVLRNEGRWDTSNALFADGRVKRYDKRSPTPDMQWIDYGLGMMRREVLEESDAPDLAEVYTELAERGELAGYEATERFYEIGTPDSLLEADAFLRSLASKRRAATSDNPA
jgi:prepilin-type processing-associated H-X9-DG protein